MDENKAETKLSPKGKTLTFIKGLSNIEYKIEWVYENNSIEDK